MRELYWKLEMLGRVRLSEHFYMRQFLHSEIAAAFSIVNFPDFPEVAIETGSKLCAEVLEPLHRLIGPLVIRSGFRSAKLNAFGAAKGLSCASNNKNFAYHIWDHLDRNGHKGAAACVVAPSFNDRHAQVGAWKELAWLIHDNVPFHRLTFFSRDSAFNIGWHEHPSREIFSRVPRPHWLLGPIGQAKLRPIE